MFKNIALLLMAGISLSVCQSSNAVEKESRTWRDH